MAGNRARVQPVNLPVFCAYCKLAAAFIKGSVDQPAAPIKRKIPEKVIYFSFTCLVHLP